MAKTPGSNAGRSKKKGSALDTYRSSADLGRPNTGKPWQHELVGKFRGQSSANESSSLGIQRGAGVKGAKAGVGSGKKGKGKK